MAQPLWKMDRRRVIVFKTHPPDDPATPLLGIYPREMKTYFQTETRMQAIVASLFIIAPKWEKIQESING